MRIFFLILTAPLRLFGGFFTAFREVLTAPPPEDTPLGETFERVVADPYGLFEHVNVLRSHLTRAVVFLALATAFSFTFIRPIMAYLAQPLENGMQSLIAIDPTEPVGTVMRVALLAGFTLSFPYIGLELWLFIASGLIDMRKRRQGLLAIPFATFLFVLGMAFSFYVMLPAGLPFLLNFGGFATELRPSSYYSFVTGIMFWIGLFFEFPLVIFVLASIGFVKPKLLRDQWRLAFVIISIIAAMITPTVDPVNMSLVIIPMFVLYLLSIGLARIGEASFMRQRKTDEKQPRKAGS